MAKKASPTIRRSHRVKAISLLKEENEHIRAFSGFELTQSMKESSLHMAQKLNLPIYEETTYNPNNISDRTIHHKNKKLPPIKKGPSFTEIVTAIEKNKKNHPPTTHVLNTTITSNYFK